MKRLTAIFFSAVLLIALATPAHATKQAKVIAYQESTLENGLLVIDEIIDVSQARSTDKSYRHTKTFKDGNTVIAIIAISATFRYDGSTVSVISKTVSQSDTYGGWNYTEKSFTSSSGTVTLEAKLTKWLILSTSFTMTLSCDRNGNISYT